MALMSTGSRAMFLKTRPLLCDKANTISTCFLGWLLASVGQISRKSGMTCRSMGVWNRWMPLPYSKIDLFENENSTWKLGVDGDGNYLSVIKKDPSMATKNENKNSYSPRWPNYPTYGWEQWLVRALEELLISKHFPHWGILWLYWLAELLDQWIETVGIS